MKKQETVRMAVWTMILAVAVGTVVLRTALGAPAPVPAVVGDWNGAVTTGNGSLRVVLHVSQDKGGSLAGTLDSPDQGARGIAVSTITFKDPSLHFESGSIGGVYDGKINKDSSEIAGEWKQNGATVPLTFKRVEKK